MAQLVYLQRQGEHPHPLGIQCIAFPDLGSVSCSYVVPRIPGVRGHDCASKNRSVYGGAVNAPQDICSAFGASR